MARGTVQNIEKNKGQANENRISGTMSYIGTVPLRTGRLAIFKNLKCGPNFTFKNVKAARVS